MTTSISEEPYHFDLGPDGIPGWRRMKGDTILSVEAPAEALTERLLDLAEKCLPRWCLERGAARSQAPERKRTEKLGPYFDEPKMVEAAGVEPASGSVVGEATPCSASSWFSPRRLEKRQNGGRATPNSFRERVRGTAPATPEFRDVGRSASGALTVQRGYLIKQPERSCCCSQLLFFTLLLRGGVRPRHATSRAIVPVEAVSPPRSMTRLKDRTGNSTIAFMNP